MARMYGLILCNDMEDVLANILPDSTFLGDRRLYPAKSLQFRV